MFILCLYRVFLHGALVLLICDPLVLTLKLNALENIRSKDLLLQFLDPNEQFIKACWQVD